MFYGAEQAAIHDRFFGKLATYAADDLITLLRGSGLSSGTVIDLGCGSGILAARVGSAGYDVIGVDISPDMVALARVNAPAATITVGSLHDAPLPDRCAGVATTGEALNYATDQRAGLDALSRLAGRVYQALVPGGCWLFDVSGPGRGGPTRIRKEFHRQPDWCLGVTAVESADGDRLEREITIFTSVDGDVYQRTEEHHTLRLFRSGDVKELVRAAGFTVEVLPDYRSPPVPIDLPGWYVIEARKPR